MTRKPGLSETSVLSPFKAYSTSIPEWWSILPGPRVLMPPSPIRPSLFGPLGFRVPRTLVTNRPEAALAFYEEMDGQVIYKSTSYVRSIVKRMEPEDLERLDTLANCPLQIQEAIEGFDVRGPCSGGANFRQSHCRRRKRLSL